MSIRAVHVQHFRSIGNAALARCGGLNVLIGKNNAGKSNLLSAISLVLSHLQGGKIAAPWVSPRARGEFNQGDSSTLVRIAVEFSLSPQVNQDLRERLTMEAPHLDRSIDQIKSHDSVVFILGGALDEPGLYLFVEQIAVGRLTHRGEDFLVEGIKLLTVTRAVASELFRNVVSTQTLTRDLEIINDVRAGRGMGAPWEFVVQQPKDRRMGYIYRVSGVRPDIVRRIEIPLASANTADEMQQALSQIATEIREKVEAEEKRETQGVISAFAGERRVPPAYAGWLMQQFGSLPILQIKEVKQQIGREEAETLLRLKVRRKGPERLVTVQRTVKALLGVSLDAFEAETRGGERRAEMDVDDFLVEANGAGIREALRLILDLELKNPQLVLIEEPEVHLHPGLARVIASYLKEKSQDIQMFITTHSTDFVDFVPFQTVFLVSRDKENKTVCQTVEAEEASLKIPAELGLRLSTVFMFDRLVFVEGPSDESVFREFARKLDIDLTKSNVGFVYMQGTRNFAHFAAEATLNLLSKRQIQMHFVLDRDEKDDGEIKRMMLRLGDRAKLVVLRRREMENYLLDPPSVLRFIDEKLTLTGSDRARPNEGDVRDAIEAEAASLKDEVIRLRLESRLLKPIYLHMRTLEGTVAERLSAGSAELAERRERIEQDRSAITAEVESEWPRLATHRAPGSLILARVAARFGARFSKDAGDSERLARLLPDEKIDAEIKDLLQEIADQWLKAATAAI
jgi:putative ATP-dependent endonuclease of the OLD family